MGVGTVAAGFYSGNLTGRAGSALAAIVGSDGSIYNADLRLAQVDRLMRRVAVASL